MRSDADDEPPVPPREDTQPIPIQERPVVSPPVSGRSSPPPRAAIVGAVAVVLALTTLVVLNLIVARQAQTRAEQQAQMAIGAPVDVDLRGFPVGLRLLSGARLDARVRARDVPLEGTAATLTSLVVDLQDARLDRTGEGAIEARQATFTAELDDDAVQQLIGLPGRIPLADVELGNGVARFTIARFPLLDATAAVEDGRVVFQLTAPIANLLDVQLQLDELPLGFRADHVEIRRGVLRLEGSARDLRLEG
jgi:hypothetical protein